MRSRREAVCATLAVALAWVRPSFAQSAPTAKASAGGPTWNSLTDGQREALAPLAPHWATIPADRKRKWLEIADKYPQLSPEGKQRLHQRMGEFIKLTPQQRQTARENFQRAYELPPQQRQSAVEQYRALPPEKKKELSERSKRKDSARPAEKK